MFTACRNCPRSAMQAQEEVLDPCCEPYAQPSPWLSSLGQRKRGIGWATGDSKFIHWLLFLARGGQSVVSHFCVDKLSELQMSLVRELTSTITLILMRRAGIHIQLKPWKLIPVMDRDWIRFSTNKLFSRRDYSIHLQYKNMIYSLTLFWNNFLNLTFFLVITQIANCRSYLLINNARCWFA